jgi:hypothetical protein
MNIRAMKKAELVALCEQLNESRVHCDAVIAGLRAELEALRAKPAEPNGAGVQHTPTGMGTPRNTQLVHYFDPDVPGSYARALRNARDQGGVVRRTVPVGSAA